jgi:hypothetical protein
VLTADRLPAAQGEHGETDIQDKPCGGSQAGRITARGSTRSGRSSRHEADDSPGPGEVAELFLPIFERVGRLQLGKVCGEAGEDLLGRRSDGRGPKSPQMFKTPRADLLGFPSEGR